MLLSLYIYIFFFGGSFGIFQDFLGFSRILQDVVWTRRIVISADAFPVITIKFIKSKSIPLSSGLVSIVPDSVSDPAPIDLLLFSLPRIPRESRRVTNQSGQKPEIPVFLSNQIESNRPAFIFLFVLEMMAMIAAPVGTSSYRIAYRTSFPCNIFVGDRDLIHCCLLQFEAIGIFQFRVSLVTDRDLIIAISPAV